MKSDSQEVQDIEQKRKDLLPEHQRMEKISQKVAQFAGHKETMPKRMRGKCNGDVERIRDEIAEREGGSAPRTGTRVPEDLLGRSEVG